MKRVSIWLTSSSSPQLYSNSEKSPEINNKLHVTLVTAIVKSASEVEALVEKVKKLSVSLATQTIVVRPPSGSEPKAVLDTEKTRILLPIAGSVELDNLYETASQLLQNPEVWEPSLVICQGKAAPMVFDAIEKDPSCLKVEVVLDTIEITVSGCCNRCHNSVHIGKNPMGTAWFYRSANLIDGNWVETTSGESMNVFNPATGKAFHQIPVASQADVNKAVESAKAAFPSWSNLTAATRSKYLIAMADVIDKRKEDLARLEVLDNGKPLKEAIMDMNDVSQCFRYYAELALKVNPTEQDGQALQIPDASFSAMVRYEPVGVCALIASFNYPLLIATWKVAPCLASGSTCVLKPSELTSLTALELAAIAVEVGLPAGVLNVVTGPGNSTGAALVEHPLVDKVAFTGSFATGSHVMKVSAKKVNNVTLELGGKSPLIVCRDADIDAIMDWILLGIFFNSGQVCSATSRVLVHTSLYQKVLERLVAEVKKIAVGSGFDDSTQMGPLVSENQQRKVLDYITKGKAEGARVIVGGTSDPKQYGSGYFVEPTVFADVKPWMKIWKEEIFGPVLSVTSFETEAEAIEMANDSVYGLAGAVFSTDKETCRRVARELRCGIVWINCSQPTFVQAPWGGYKQSGLGRELGPWGLQNYLQTKQITSWIDPNSTGWGWYQQSKI